VEYTLFTPCLLASEAYELGLKEYINRYITKSVYSIEETEWGVIPMNNEKLPFLQGGIYQLGMAGGQTKPSTGYTFQFIQKQTDFIVETLRYGKKLPKSYKSSHRFKFYDSVLLDLLIRKRPPGDKIFGRLFERNVASEVFRFLDNETNFFQELRLISSLPVWPFLKAAVRRMTSRR
jgi:lycopene beta-cyclase